MGVAPRQFGSVKKRGQGECLEQPLQHLGEFVLAVRLGDDPVQGTACSFRVVLELVGESLERVVQYL